MAIPTLSTLEEAGLPALNQALKGLDRRLNSIDAVVPTAETDETKFSHKIPLRIGGTTYYLMLTTS